MLSAVSYREYEDDSFKFNFAARYFIMSPAVDVGLQDTDLTWPSRMNTRCSLNGVKAKLLISFMDGTDFRHPLTITSFNDSKLTFTNDTYTSIVIF